MESLPLFETRALRRTAIILVFVGLLWNLVEAGVSLWSGLGAGSVALLAFGLDSVIELLAGGVLLWRFSRVRDESEEGAAETRARRLLGLSFLLLAVYVTVHSGSNLLGWFPEPQPSLIGVGIVAASAVVMSVLYVSKMRIATRMQSWSLRAEALETLFCDLQDLSILVGLGLNALLSWWWADPVSALVLVPLFVKEGLENLSDDEEEDEGQERHVCFCLSCYYGLRTCAVAACRAQLSP